MRIEILNPADEKKWDEFVLNSPLATYCHLLGWREVIKKSYGHQGLYLIAKEKDEIVGILPTFLLKSKIFGKQVISLPFLNYSGILAKDLEVAKSFVDYLKNYTKINKFDSFQLRQRQNKNLELSADLSNLTFILKLDKNPEIIWKQISSKTRNHIRNANKFNLRLKSGHQYLKDFYKLYQQAMNRLGTPTHGYVFFQNILKEFSKQTKVFVVEYKNKFIASAIFFEFKDILANPWSAADAKYRQLNANNFLYWEIIKSAGQNNFKYFDFGRSYKESGTVQFKKQWSAEIRQLFYYEYPAKQKSDRNKYRKMVKIWTKLPLIITNFIGPHLRKFVA